MSESLSRDRVKRRYGRRTTLPPVAGCSPAARPPADGSEEPRKSIHPDRRLRNEAAIPEDRKLALQAQSYAAERHQECCFRGRAASCLLLSDVIGVMTSGRV